MSSVSVSRMKHCALGGTEHLAERPPMDATTRFWQKALESRSKDEKDSVHDKPCSRSRFMANFHLSNPFQQPKSTQRLGAAAR